MTLNRTTWSAARETEHYVHKKIAVRSSVSRSKGCFRLFQSQCHIQRRLFSD